MPHFPNSAMMAAAVSMLEVEASPLVGLPLLALHTGPLLAPTVGSFVVPSVPLAASQGVSCLVVLLLAAVAPKPFLAAEAALTRFATAVGSGWSGVLLVPVTLPSRSAVRADPLFFFFNSATANTD